MVAPGNSNNDPSPQTNQTLLCESNIDTCDLRG